MSWTAVLTNAGAELFASYMQNNLSLSVDTVKTGTGILNTPEARRAATALVSEKSEGYVISKSALTMGVQFRLRVKPATEEEGTYTLKELGLFINADNGSTVESVMVAYANEVDGGINIPLESNFPDFSYMLSINLGIDPTTPITLTVDPSAFVSYAEVQEIKEELEESIQKKLETGQGSENAGKFMVVGNDGNIIPALLSFIGTTASTPGKYGLVPAPQTTDVDKWLNSDGTWKTLPVVNYTANNGIVLNGTVFGLANSGVTAGTYGPSGNVTGNNNATIKVPQLVIDSYGRVTGAYERTLTLKNTEYSAGAGLGLSGGVFSLVASGVSAGSYGPTGDVTGNNNSTIKVPRLTFDAYGRCTGASEKTLTLKNTEYVDFSGASASAAGTHGLVPAPAKGDQAKFLRADKTWAYPPETVYTAGTGLSLSNKQFSLANSGATAGTYGQSSDVTGNHGQTMKVPYFSVDAKGRITSIYNKTVTFVNTTYGDFRGATASAGGEHGLVPAPGAGHQYDVLYGMGGWATLQNLLNATGAIAQNKMNNVGRQISFKWGEVNNVPAINGQASQLFQNAFPEACFCVFTQLASNHNGEYVRIRTYGWDKNGFGYQAQTAAGGNVSFYYLAIGY